MNAIRSKRFKRMIPNSYNRGVYDQLKWVHENSFLYLLRNLYLPSNNTPPIPFHMYTKNSIVTGGDVAMCPFFCPIFHK